MTIMLKGMTWDHPRGYDPLVACSNVYAEQTGVLIQWDKRSLQDFESYPVDELAQAYDLIVIDHPHVGQVVGEDCLLPLDTPGREGALAALATNTVGPSLASYTWDGRQWALPIDAASQVQAYRPDRINERATDMDIVLTLARQGKILLPLKSPHALMTFYSIAANFGYVCGGDTDFIARDEGVIAYEALARLVEFVDPVNFELDPIDALELMARLYSQHVVSPYIFGYVNYAVDGFREATLSFSDVPAIGTGGARGAVLGGTGMAVSSYCKHRDTAIDFAYWVAGADVQAGPYAQAGGQPGHRGAWTNDQVNRPVHNFYLNTLETLDRSYLRPRFDGYMSFQDAASRRLSAALLARDEPLVVIDELCVMYHRFKKGLSNASCI